MGAYIARVSWYDTEAPKGRQTLFYAVIAVSKDAARTAVRDAVGLNRYVEIVDGRLSPDTAAALGLKAGVAKAM